MRWCLNATKDRRQRGDIAAHFGEELTDELRVEARLAEDLAVGLKGDRRRFRALIRGRELGGRFPALELLGPSLIGIRRGVAQTATERARGDQADSTIFPGRGWSLRIARQPQ